MSTLFFSDFGLDNGDKHTIQAGIPRHVTEEVKFIAFRFYGRAPMVGYRDKTVFYVLWLDRDFNLYSH